MIHNSRMMLLVMAFGKNLEEPRADCYALKTSGRGRAVDRLVCRDPEEARAGRHGLVKYTVGELTS